MCADVLVFCAHTLLFCICVRVVRGVHKHQGLQMTGSVRVFRWRTGCALTSLFFVHKHTLMFCICVRVVRGVHKHQGLQMTGSVKVFWWRTGCALMSLFFVHTHYCFVYVLGWCVAYTSIKACR